jgi:transaldolase
MFPTLDDNDIRIIAEQGKIPNHQQWQQQIHNRSIAPDTLLNLAGLASFTKDQAALDNRIRKLIS